MITDLYITPQGMLRDTEETFATGNGNGLLTLTQTEFSEAVPGKLYFKKIFVERIRRLAATGEPADGKLAGLFELTRPNESECAFQVLSAPPLTGAEYFDGALLLRFQQEFEQTLQGRFNSFSGTFTDFIRTLAPEWKNVGKVSFHLAENKGDATGTHPFAFMASFIYRADGDRPKHLPLAAALKAYAGDSRSMTAVLAPIQQAAEKSEFVRKLLESRRIFQPSAWTGEEAYAFLRDIPLCEEANIVVRIASLWEPPPKAKVSVTLDTAKHPLGADSLLAFSVGVTLDGKTLSGKKLTRFSTRRGIVRIKASGWRLSRKNRRLLKQCKSRRVVARQWHERRRRVAAAGRSRSGFPKIH